MNDNMVASCHVFVFSLLDGNFIHPFMAWALFLFFFLLSISNYESDFMIIKTDIS
jgi:hypothetical protein